MLTPAIAGNGHFDSHNTQELSAVPTSALATIGVLPPCASFPRRGDEDYVLDIANEYRLALVDLYHERHCRTVDLRDKLFPGLFAAMVEYEALGAQIAQLEREIKEHHSRVRDRNAVTKDQEQRLSALRAALRAARAKVAEEKAPWLQLFRDFREWWKSVAPPIKEGRKPTAKLTGWTDVKTLERRRELYAALKLPDGPVGEYAAMYIELDLAERELDREFSVRLHSAIRAEVKRATQPKMTKDGPGVRYRYGKPPEVQPWKKLTLQFVGGLKWEKAIEGTSQFSVRHLYTNHCAGGDEPAYLVRQQIGTAKDPRWAEYVIKDPALARVTPDMVIQQWSLVVRGNKRVVVPIFKDVPAKPIGSGVCAYKLRWTIRKESIEIAHIWGEHVNERVQIPRWIVERILRVKDEQAIVDLRCNELLSRRGAMPETGKKQGMEALAVHARDYPLDNAVATLLDDCQRTMHLVRKDAESARRAIEDIYNVVANKVLGLHSHIVHDDIDLARIKRYDTRDLLREDVLPEKAREILFAVSPGKLRLRLQRRRLPASDEVPSQPPEGARETDHWTSYVNSLGRKTGTKPSGRRHRSQSDTGVVVAE